MSIASSDPPSSGSSARPAAYSIGTLIYTRAGLISLFGWLLWGDFVFTLMEAVVPSLLPLLLRQHEASNYAIITIVTTLYMVMNSALNPVISYQSDRFRSRWGRRRPFIFVTTPFVVLFLIAIPFAPEILSTLRSLPLLDHLFALSPIAPLVLVFGLLVGGFQAFNMFISSVYYYLIPDVVPLAFIGRFYGLFRIFGTAAAMLYNYFIFGLAEHHLRAIFVITALLYGCFILLMCWQVKEGQYPPPLDEPHDHWWRGIQNYFRECFGQSYYWWVFLAYSAITWAAVGNVFNIFFYQNDLGFSLDLIGKTGTWGNAAFILCSYPFGLLMDRWGCHKALFLALAGAILCSLLMYFLAIDRITGVLWTILRSIPLSLCGMALMKWTVEVYPRERYGQFGSAGALFSSLGGIVASCLYVTLVDWLKDYRVFLLWHAAFSTIALVAALVVYRRWKDFSGSAKQQTS